MTDVCLLSEINPGGTNQFNPLRQAADWFGLVDDDEIRDFKYGDIETFSAAMGLIRQRASERGLALVIRDWSHLDWIGFPFARPTMTSAWDAVRMPIESDGSSTGSLGDFKLKDPSRTAAAKTRTDAFLNVRCATVRHPVDQYLRTKRLGALEKVWDDRAVWRGMHEFAKFVQSITWIRYEDFLHCPASSLRKICGALEVRYDEGWQHRWQDYHTITGDAPRERRLAISPKPRVAVDRKFWKSLRRNEDFFATLDLLGYPTPEPLRRRWYAGSDLPADRLIVAAETNQFVGSIPVTATETDSTPALPYAKRCDCPRPTLQDAARSVGDEYRCTDWDDEVVQARQAFEESSDDAVCSIRLATALGWIGQVDEAADVLLKWVHDRDPSGSVDITAVMRVFSTTCDMLDRAERKYESIPIRRHWAQLDPTHQGNLFQLSILLAGVGEVDEALFYCRRLLSVDARHIGAAANYLLYMNYSDRHTAAEISNEHFRIGMHFTQPSDSVPRRPRMTTEKIRVGYLGSDFYTHPVGKIILPILQSHDRQRCEISIYHDGKKSDATTGAIKNTVNYFSNVSEFSDEQLMETVRTDDLDVLIDLGGYTGGGNRLKILARRLAPVQASFLGYPHTSAIPAMDYRLTDRFADPPGLTDHLYGEQLVWLEHAHLAWRPYEIAESIVPTPSENPMLGIFNNVAKLSPTAIAAYAQILRRVPRASILFKYGDRYGVSSLRDRFLQAFAAHGVAPHRLQFRTQTETLMEHLQSMANVDLALDAFPYQGTMTSLECLCVGTPIVTCCGDYYAHRATSAMMIRLGLQELVADDCDEYIEIAVELLHDRSSLRSLRSDVLQRFNQNALTDPIGLARELESTFEEWIR